MTTIQTFRDELETNLRAEFSWLSLVGLFWLNEGDNTFGAGASNTIVLPEGSAPASGGTFFYDGETVEVRLAENVLATIEDQPVRVASMQPDTSGEPTFLRLNDLRFMVIRRGGKLAMRVWWSQHPARLNFEGRQWYDVQDAFRIEAQVKRYDPPKKVIIPDMIGNETESEMQVQLLLDKNGQTFTVDAMEIPDGRYYIIFKDATSQTTTYPAARFLISEAPEGETVVVDFNKAYSPPCAFTPHATCPLPIPENILSLAIEAGERYGSK